MDTKVRRLIAEMISGLALPHSLGMLGTAQKPYDELRKLFHLFGYQYADEIETAIAEYEAAALWEGKHGDEARS